MKKNCMLYSFRFLLLYPTFSFFFKWKRKQKRSELAGTVMTNEGKKSLLTIIFRGIFFPLFYFAIDRCVFILHPTTLNVFNILPSSFLWIRLYFTCQLCHSPYHIISSDHYQISFFFQCAAIRKKKAVPSLFLCIHTIYKYLYNDGMDER